MRVHSLLMLLCKADASTSFTCDCDQVEKQKSSLISWLRYISGEMQRINDELPESKQGPFIFGNVVSRVANLLPWT